MGLSETRLLIMAYCTVEKRYSAAAASVSE